MLFNSHLFLFGFLPLTWAGFYLLGRTGSRGPWLAASWLALASLFFYGYWSTQYLWLLGLSIVFNYLVGLSLARQSAYRHVLLILGLSGNLAALAYYKYANFFVSNLNQLGGLGLDWAEVVLPIGISFFTFTQIAFLVDVYKGVASEYRFVHYVLFVTYFPHLIAGPILHHKEMMPQFANPATYRINAVMLATGLSWFSIGLAKKVLLADSLAGFVDPVFDAADRGLFVGFFEAWSGATAYSLQLYFDFSGYSDMAVGLSMLFGVKLPLNFNSPYKAASIIDFWRRWHMTLSRFLRDYLYIPLGGNRKGKPRRYLNLMITMLLGGLWHGAGWTYALWGVLHGFYLILNHTWRAAVGRTLLVQGYERHPMAFQLAGIVITYLAVVLAWAVFRAQTIGGAGQMLSAMIGLHGFTDDAPDSKLLVYMVLGLGICWFLPNTQELLEYRNKLLSWKPSAGWAWALGLIFSFSVFSLSRYSPFIYFQF